MIIYNNNNVFKKALSLNSSSLALPTLNRLATRQHQQQQRRRRRQQQQILLMECNKKILLSLGFKLKKNVSYN